ncbi:DUF4276 family protein [Chloroflexus sp.]|uniref:DUF4276 family protein n=1 Tax=Chloroflexus sp. TaxID=1904827 RepID=UPI002ACE0AFC|nr:DUF4276 family protein [Chloroflexus sp.]
MRFRCIAHEGKNDLKQSILRKLRAWPHSEHRFVVLIGQDRADCRALKEELRNICQQAGRPDTIIRIACTELEAWYFGDTAALARAFHDERLQQLEQKRQHRASDRIAKPGNELEHLIPEFRKIDAARRMSQQLTQETNRSHSFRVFIHAISQIAAEFGAISDHADDCSAH